MSEFLLFVSMFTCVVILWGVTYIQAASPQIIIDPETKKIYITTGYFQNTWEQQEVITPTTSDNAELTWETVEVEKEVVEPAPQDGLTEFEQALAWMYANGLTKYNDAEAYRPNDWLTREESSKIVGQLYTKLGYDQAAKTIECSFLDADNFDPSLAPHIDKVCKWKLFQGYEGSFFPQQSLTRPQTLAVLIRMFQWKFSNEEKTPWRNDYYLKAQKIGIISDSNAKTFDKAITREEVALYVFRLKNIATNDKLATMAKNAMNQVDNASAMKEELTSDNLSALAGTIDASKDPELQEAVKWMYDNGLTSFDTVQDYRPFEILLREEAAKMLHMFAQIYELNTSYENYMGNECEFADADAINPWLKEHVESVCKLGIFQGKDGMFNPISQTYKADFVAALIKMLEQQSLDETTIPWWKNYFEKAQELGIVGPADAVTFENPITRYEVALFLYRFKVKYQMMRNLNSSRLQNEILSTVPGSAVTWTNWLPQANIYVDINLIKDGNFEIGYIEIMGTRYKVVKTAIETYWEDNYVWYGDLFDLATDEKAGTVSFIMGNWALLEGTIRTDTNSKDYIIEWAPETSSYYTIRQLAP